jgi:hypothetical protein
LYGRSGRTLACIPTVHACRVCDCTYFDTDDPRSCTPVRYVMGPRPTLTCSARWATERLPPSRGHDNLAWGGGAGRGAADRPSPRGGELRAQRRTGGTAALAAGGGPGRLKNTRSVTPTPRPSDDSAGRPAWRGARVAPLALAGSGGKMGRRAARGHGGPTTTTHLSSPDRCLPLPLPSPRAGVCVTGVAARARVPVITRRRRARRP